MRRFYMWIVIGLLFGFLCLLGASFAKNDVSLPQNKPTSDKTIDLDLSTMKSTMIYATVNDIMMRPKKYLGKTMKISGLYDRSYDQQTDKYYHYVVIEDATACCQQGMEFVFGEIDSLDDFPAVGAKIVVVGVFGSYEELDISYFYIEADEVKGS